MTTRQTSGGLHENTANIIIAEWLNSAKREWSADGERTQRIQGSSKRPDIIITEGDRMPVIIEAEYDDKSEPGVGDAKKRLGKKMVGETRPFTEVIALGISSDCRRDSNDGLRARLESDEPFLSVQLVSQVEEGNVKVWPNEPLPATPRDLIAYCEYSQVPQTVIEKQSGAIATRIQSAGEALLGSVGLTSDGENTLARIREATGAKRAQDDSDDENFVPPYPNEHGYNRMATQTACAIWLTAIDLQNDLARYSGAMKRLNLKSADTLRDEAISGKVTARTLLEQWEIIKSVNYLPVIEIAIDCLDAGELGNAAPDVLTELCDLSDQMNALHAKHVYNFAGELWQRLVVDREERAAHYTKPEIAETLATLSMERFDGLGAEEIGAINLMDAACGTGTLVGAGERALRRKYAAMDGEDPELHRKRMENHIYAMDVNGIAGTLTAKRLTDMDVEQEYSESRIAVITDPAGSLILMDPGVTGVSRVLGYQSATPESGEEGQGSSDVFHVMLGGMQWALMNPPYARPRKGRRQASLGLNSLRQKARRAKYAMSHGQAGLATDFGNLCNIRLAPGGVYANVLPLTAAHAGTWKNWRRELEKDFENIVAIANTSQGELQSMSADTGMSEMLVVATKRARRPDQWNSTTILCVNLSQSPTTLAEGYAIAREISAIPAENEWGNIAHGIYTRMEQATAGSPWGAVGNSNNEMNQVIAALKEGKAHDPLTLEDYDLALEMSTLGDMAETGPTHHLIGHPKGNDPIGAFEWTPLADLANAPAQQAMWAADGKRQTRILASPTHGGIVVDRSLSQQMVKQRSEWHISRNLRWTSQAIAFAKTPRQAHGGSSWNALQEIQDEVGQCMALYYNSTIGAIALSGVGNSTQSGRARVQVTAISNLPFPAFNAGTSEAERARDIANQRFDELSRLKLQPFAYCFRDENRRRIDDTVAEMLGLDPQDGGVQDMLAHYRLLFAREPNVNGRNRGILGALGEYEKDHKENKYARTEDKLDLGDRRLYLSGSNSHLQRVGGINTGGSLSRTYCCYIYGGLANATSQEQKYNCC